MTQLELARFVWARELNQPYRWGGDDPIGGFDCSGLVIEGLKSCGLFPRDGDTTADGLRRMFPMAPVPLLPGCLLFWGPLSRVTHVEIVWELIHGAAFTLGASGGGSATVSASVAEKQNAYVKIRPAREGWTIAVDPFHEERP